MTVTVALPAALAEADVSDVSVPVAAVLVCAFSKSSKPFSTRSWVWLMPLAMSPPSTPSPFRIFDASEKPFSKPLRIVLMKSFRAASSLSSGCWALKAAYMPVAPATMRLAVASAELSPLEAFWIALSPSCGLSASLMPLMAELANSDCGWFLLLMAT